MAKNQARRAVSGDPANPIKGAGLGPAAAKRQLSGCRGVAGEQSGLPAFAAATPVLTFYPRADTSGCTREAVDLSRLKSAFSRAGTEILGISADPVAALDRFKSKHKLTIALASDEAHKVLDAYGVWQQKTLYGRKF